jgi:TonB-dependent receptor
MVDGPGQELKGFELSFQAPFSSLGAEGVLGNFGILANYTYVDGDQDYSFERETYTERVPFLSNHQWNGTLYYEGDKFSIRASVAHRDDFISSARASGNGNLFTYTVGSTYVDMSAVYTVTDNLAVTLEGLNLTDEPLHTELDRDARRLFSNDHTGRDILLGVRYEF